METLKEAAIKLENAIKRSQELAKKLAAAPPPHKLKTPHKEFWSKVYADIQISGIELIKKAEIYFQTREIALPWDDDDFLKMWNRYQIYWMEEHGYLMSEVRQEEQLNKLQEYAADAAGAIRMLRHFINRGDKYIYKVNFEKANQPKESQNELTDEDYQ